MAGEMTKAPMENLPPQLVEAMKSPMGQATIQSIIGGPPEPPTYLELPTDGAPLSPDMAMALTTSTTTHLKRMLNFRRQFDSTRIKYYRQYIGQNPETKYPDNITKRSNTFVPYPLSNVEQIVSRASDAFFAYDPWFECRPRTMQDDGPSEAMQTVLGQKLKASNFYEAFGDLLRNVCIYGHAAIKVDWDWSYDSVVTAEPIFAQIQDPQSGQMVQIPNPMTGEPVVIGYNPVRKLVPRARPKFTPIDVFDLLIDPDGGMVAHMVERTFGQMKMEASVNPKLYYPEALQELSTRLSVEKDPDNVIIRMAEFWDEGANTCTLMTFGDDAEALTWKDSRFAYRAGQSYSSFRRRVYAGPSLLLWHGSNQFLHSRAPILCTNYIKLPNEQYGLGAVEVISDLTESYNRFVNMITDNWNMGINKRYAYDTNADIDHTALNTLNVPGGKVAVSGEPSKVLFPLPIFTPNQGDYEILNVYKSMMEMTSGVSDFYAKGIGSSGGNRTATGISQIIGEGAFRFKMFIRNIEIDILQPLLAMCACMIQQFITDDVEVMITDAPAGIPKFYAIPADKLIGAFDFDLVAANYATQKVLKQRNLLALAQLAAESPYIDQHSFLTELGKVYEIRNLGKIIKTPEQVAQEQAAAQQHEIQMMIFEAMLQAETQARIGQSKPQTGTGQGAGGGRPTRYGSASKTKGAGLTSAIRDFAQNMTGGARDLGLEGLGEVNAG